MSVGACIACGDWPVRVDESGMCQTRHKAHVVRCNRLLQLMGSQCHPKGEKREYGEMSAQQKPRGRMG